MVATGRPVFATERNKQAGTGMVESLLACDRNLMKNVATEPRKTKRITGALHMPGYAHPAARQDANLPREKAEESEVAGQHKNTGQKDHKGAR